MPSPKPCSGSPGSAEREKALQAKAADLLEIMAAAMEEHMAKEETILFPMMRTGGHPMIVHPIACMRHEHDEHGENLARLDKLTGGGALPDDACTTWRALYVGIGRFVADLTEHVHLENNRLFPRFE
ncbi:MAG: hypothetical protein HC888_10205 [Candidatus Competibacteraceae bacterium]|nr:hypothetical protein [Candidatus Competibacteraceae bacterium]